jgi:putative beta-lysine N-acetyltransferase
MELLGNSLIQHGPANDRVYLMKLDRGDLPDIVSRIYELGRQQGYSKLFAKVPADAASHFTDLGFVDEALVPNMYRGSSAGLFLSKYLDPKRAMPKDIQLISDVLDRSHDKADKAPIDTGDIKIERLRTGNAETLAHLYSDVFETYPFPLDDPSFIRKSMSEDTIFFGIFSDDILMAAASAEIDTEWQCAEMTDFATRPEYRGKGVATKLLAHMEETLVGMDIKTLYTIARAGSYGMNIVFSRCGYAHGGTLHNNTQIGGELESMNVWHKQIGER